MSSVQMRVERGVVVVSVPDRVDISNTRALVDPIRAQIIAGRREVVLDFKGNHMIDSTALGALVQLFKSLTGQGGNLVLAEVGDAVRTLLSITRLDSVFTLRDTATDAVASLAS